MKITIESTTKIVSLDGVQARVWEGHTESGIAVHCFITRIGVQRGLDTSQFERELEEQRPPSALIDATYPARMVL
jgi:hypothetical protein